MASSRAHLRLDSWWPRPAQESQCLPGQSILLPQYKYLSWRVCCLLFLDLLERFLRVMDVDIIENPFVESREEIRKSNAITEMQTTRPRISDLGFGFGFGLGVLFIVAITPGDGNQPNHFKRYKLLLLLLVFDWRSLSCGSWRWSCNKPQMSFVWTVGLINLMNNLHEDNHVHISTPSYAMSHFSF